MIYKRNKNLADEPQWPRNKFGPGRGWFSFVIDGEYYSFNFINANRNLSLMIQHYGPSEQPKGWDIHWIDFSNRVPPIMKPDPDSWDFLKNDSKKDTRVKREDGYDPERERKLQLRRSDGLFQYVLGRHFHNFSLAYNFLLLKGHRDWKTTAKISVTFQFTYKFMISIGLTKHYRVMPLIAIRTINELNGIFKRSGTLIKLYVHCIEGSFLEDRCCHPASEVLDAYARPMERISSDLLIAFVHELEGENIMTYPYRFHEGKSVVVVNSVAFLDIFDIAHAIGHVLGAGHTPDPIDPDYKVPSIFYARGFIQHESGYCTIMSPQPCLMIPLFSTPRDAFHQEIFGVRHLHDNSAWIKQNRFAWQAVGDETSTCRQGKDMPYIPWFFKCFDMDVTSPNSTGKFKVGQTGCPTKKPPKIVPG